MVWLPCASTPVTVTDALEVSPETGIKPTVVTVAPADWSKNVTVPVGVGPPI
jgi:hypothetical protein